MSPTRVFVWPDRTPRDHEPADVDHRPAILPGRVLADGGHDYGWRPGPRAARAQVRRPLGSPLRGGRLGARISPVDGFR
jgi:hypothetical protein